MRQQFAVMKGEEEGVERARKALEEETGEGRGRGETVRREMEGFRSAMEEFEVSHYLRRVLERWSGESWDSTANSSVCIWFASKQERTKSVREEHQRFLVGVV